MGQRPLQFVILFTIFCNFQALFADEPNFIHDIKVMRESHINMVTENSCYQSIQKELAKKFKLKNGQIKMSWKAFYPDLGKVAKKDSFETTQQNPLLVEMTGLDEAGNEVKIRLDLIGYDNFLVFEGNVTSVVGSKNVTYPSVRTSPNGTVGARMVFGAYHNEDGVKGLAEFRRRAAKSDAKIFKFQKDSKVIDSLNLCGGHHKNISMIVSKLLAAHKNTAKKLAKDPTYKGIETSSRSLVPRKRSSLFRPNEGNEVEQI